MLRARHGRPDPVWPRPLTRSFETVSYHNNMYRLTERRPIAALPFSAYISKFLYNNRFQSLLVAPVVAGINPDGSTVIVSYDSIGAITYSRFVAAGTTSNELIGVSDSFYRENLEPDALVETVAQCMNAAVNRDALAGFGIDVVLLTRSGMTTYKFGARQD